MFKFNPENAKKAVKAGILAAVGLTASTPTTGQETKTQDQIKPKIETDLPTRQDSVDLLNNTKKLLEYYNDRNYKNFYAVGGIQDPWEGVPTNADFKELEKTKKSELLDMKQRRMLGLKNPKNFPVHDSDYYKKIDDNKFLTREEANTLLDTRAPMQLVDKRIKPTKDYELSNVNKRDAFFDDDVMFYGYDTLAVKPYDMLTPEEKELRKQKYGTDGFPEEKPKYQPPVGSTLIPTQFPNISILKDKAGNIKYINTLTGEESVFGDEGKFITKEQQTIRIDGETTPEDPNIFKKSKENKQEEIGGNTAME